MKALIVEDEATSRRLLHAILSPHGECNTAVDGEDAFNTFKQALNQGAPYDVIFLDISIPKIEGQEVLKMIRAYEYNLNIRGLDGVKILMATGNDENQTILTAFRNGCEGYLLKPIDQARLMKALQCLDVIPANSVTQVSKQELSEELKIFLIEAHENIDVIEKGVMGLEEKNHISSVTVSELFRSIHTIKGNCGFLGLNNLEDICHRGESILDLLRNQRLAFDESVSGLLLSMVDQIRKGLTQIEFTGIESTDSAPTLLAAFDTYLDGQTTKI